MERIVYLAVDYGRARTGLAYSEDGEFVRPWETIALSDPKALLGELNARIELHRPEHVVVGLPLAQSGDETPTSRLVRSIARSLHKECEKKALNCVIHLWDERSTTKEAARSLQASGKNSKAQRANIDVHAARVLLESWLRFRSLQQ